MREERHADANGVGWDAEWLELLWEEAAEGLRLTDASGRILAVNAAYCRMAGQSRGQLVGQPMESVYPEAERPRVRERHRDFVEGRLERSVVQRSWHTPDGRCLDVEVTFRRLERRGQRVVFSVFRDLSERRRLEQELEDSRRRSELTSAEISLLLHHVAILADASRADEANAVAFEQAFLHNLAKAYGADRAVWYRYDFERQVCVRRAEWAAPGVESPTAAPVEFPLGLFGLWVRGLLQGEHIEIEDVERLEMSDLRSILLRRGVKSVLGVPVMEAGRCVGWIGLHAVRRRRRFGAAIAQEIHSLAAVVAGVERLHAVRRQLEQTQQRLEAALAQSEQMRRAAEQADSAKTRFLAMMSHEIRTPLNGVLGVLNLLESDPLPEAAREHVGLARDSAEALLALLGDVLELARVESEAVEIEKQEIDPLELLEQTMAALAAAAADKRLVLAAVVERRLPQRIRADFARLRQVLLNLVGNAVKFTAEGSVILWAELARDKGGVALSFRVRDTGPGLSPEVMERVFEPFYQSPEQRWRTGQGAGLGLALSRRLVERMGGRIGVRSEPGYGSEFHVQLPLDLEGPHQSQTEWQPMIGLRIGLIAAHPARRDIVRWQLEQWGAEVIEEMSEGLRLDAILADWLQVEA
ncbi:MAG: PAS domain-containing sensor histidine kinase, partial [Bryobacteraceae bacterium]